MRSLGRSGGTAPSRHMTGQGLAEVGGGELAVHDDVEEEGEVEQGTAGLTQQLNDEVTHSLARG